MFKEKNLKFTVIVLMILFVLMMKLLTMTASTQTSRVPSLFYNDFAFPKDDILPLEYINGVYYVPLNLFDVINNIRIDSIDGYKDNFYIQYNQRDNIIFSILTDTAINIPDGKVSCKVYRINGGIYVPAELTARSLGLICEYNSQYRTMRIKEHTTKKSFDELIDQFLVKVTVPPPTTTTTTTAPTTPPIVIETRPPVIRPTPNNNVTQTETTSEIPTETTTAENTQEIENYIMIYDSDSDETDITDTTENTSETNQNNDDKEKSDKSKSEKIDAVLTNLKKNNIRAMFFMSGSEIMDNPDILRKIVASGNDIGIKFESGKMNFNADDLLVELESANSLIYSVVKQKVRFCTFGENGSVQNLSLYKSELKKHGYYLCGKNTDFIEFENMKDTLENGVLNADVMIDFLKRKRVNLIMIDISDDDSYLKYLDMAERAAKIKFYINFSYINNANAEVILGK